MQTKHNQYAEATADQSTRNDAADNAHLIQGLHQHEDRAADTLRDRADDDIGQRNGDQQH